MQRTYDQPICQIAFTERPFFVCTSIGISIVWTADLAHGGGLTLYVKGADIVVCQIFFLISNRMFRGMGIV